MISKPVGMYNGSGLLGIQSETEETHRKTTSRKSVLFVQLVYSAITLNSCTALYQHMVLLRTQMLHLWSEVVDC